MRAAARRTTFQNSSCEPVGSSCGLLDAAAASCLPQTLWRVQLRYEPSARAWPGFQQRRTRSFWGGIAGGMLVSETEPIVVGSVGGLVDVVTQMTAERHQLWYRGHGLAEWDVLPSIWRGYTPDDERNLTNRFRSRAAIRYSPSPGYDASARWLSLMQHYGLPTRLLDWTRSPLIAAYFALEGRPAAAGGATGQDAVIWVLDPYLLNMREGFRALTPSIDAHMCEEMLSPAFTDNKSENGKVLAAMASETDLRMFVQQGCF